MADVNVIGLDGEGGSGSSGTDPNAAGSSLPGEITESIAIANAKSVAEQPATLSNLSLGNLMQNVNQAQENAVSFQQSQNSIQATVVGKVVGMLTQLGPLEAMSAQQILTGNSVAQELSALKASVVSLNKPVG